MKILKSPIADIQYKWEAEERIALYEFLFNTLENAFNEEFFDNQQVKYDDQYEPIMRGIESHLIASYVYLFNTDCYSLINWIRPTNIYILHKLICDLPEKDHLLKIKVIMNKKGSGLTTYEKMIVLFYKSMMTWGLFYNYREEGFNSQYRSKQIRINKLFLYKLKRDLLKKYDTLKEGIAVKMINEMKIVFNQSFGKDQAILYFTRLNDEVFNGNLFNESYIFISFIDSLRFGQLKMDIDYHFNCHFAKKLIVNVFNLAQPLFEGQNNFGPFNFIKNSGKFYYDNTIITGSNWQFNGINKDSMEEELLKKATIIFHNIKKPVIINSTNLLD